MNHVVIEKENDFHHLIVTYDCLNCLLSRFRKRSSIFLKSVALAYYLFV